MPARLQIGNSKPKIGTQPPHPCRNRKDGAPKRSSRSVLDPNLWYHRPRAPRDKPERLGHPPGKGETVAHEGTHGVDQQEHGMPRTLWQFYDTEYHAYQSESYVDMGLGKANETDANPAWAPGITTQQRTTNITRDAYSNACFDVYGGSCP
jgi:hypothetical protein